MRRVLPITLALLFLFPLQGPLNHLWPHFLRPERKSEFAIYVNLWNNTLSLLRQGKEVKSYPVASGTPETPTPVGDFEVEKSKGWGGGFGSRWLGLNVPFGRYGIHGTNRPHLIGRSVSSGCIRMRNADVEELYALVQVNTPVRIDGPILGKEGLNFRVLVPGFRSSLVQLVQNRLASGGFYRGKVDGIYDRQTEKAVKAFQREAGLPVTGQIDFDDLVQLGIVE